MPRTAATTALSVGVVLAMANATAADVRREVFGHLADGREVAAITLANTHGLRARVIALGAGLQALYAPDRAGKLADVTLGYAKLEDYVAKPQFFGLTVGRYANRIAKARFTLDGKTYALPANDGANSLHGGTAGFDKVLWDVVDTQAAPAANVTLRYVSRDGEQGYPGTLTVTATYTLDEHDALSIDYRAKTDRPTIVNLSNHAYWNLAGEGSGSVFGQRLTIAADAYTPVDATLIPTGEIKPVAGSVFDFRTSKPIGRDIRDGGEVQLLRGKGYDHNFVVAREAGAAPRLMARVEDPESGRVLTLESTQPGLQFYSGNFLDGTTVGKSGRVYRQGDAFVLEPQQFPDTPNQPAFGSGRLEPGTEYRNLIVYRFSTAPAPAATK